MHYLFASGLGATVVYELRQINLLKVPNLLVTKRQNLPHMSQSLREG